MLSLCFNYIRYNFPQLDFVNIATGEASKYLVEVGADAVKVGIGIYSIRGVTGFGFSQFSTILKVLSAIKVLVLR